MFESECVCYALDERPSKPVGRFSSWFAGLKRRQEGKRRRKKRVKRQIRANNWRKGRLTVTKREIKANFLRTSGNGAGDNKSSEGDINRLYSPGKWRKKWRNLTTSAWNISGIKTLNSKSNLLRCEVEPSKVHWSGNGKSSSNLLKSNCIWNFRHFGPFLS